MSSAGKLAELLKPTETTLSVRNRIETWLDRAWCRQLYVSKALAPAITYKHTAKWLKQSFQESDDTQQNGSRTWVFALTSLETQGLSFSF